MPTYLFTSGLANPFRGGTRRFWAIPLHPTTEGSDARKEHMTNPLHNHLSVAICADAADAIAQGFNWAEKPAGEIQPIEVKKVVVVRKGTQNGNPTVDFLLQDENGQQYVFMVTGALLKSIPC